jgi:hypothetical protein
MSLPELSCLGMAAICEVFPERKKALEAAGLGE